MSIFASSIFDHLFSILSLFLTLLFVSFTLRSKKPPGSMAAWLFFIIAIPYIGIPFYILLTDRKFQFRRKKEKLVFKNAPIRLNQKTQLITDGIEAYKKNMELIESAQQCILLTTFVFANDLVGKAFAEALTQKAKQGVSVYIILDAIGTNWLNVPSFKNFKKYGGRIVTFNPILHLPFRGGNTNTRNHRKLLVVDSKMALIGGINIAEEYMGPTPYDKRWIDICMTLEGESVKDIQTIFQEDWKFATNEKPAISPTPSASPGETELQIMASGPDVKEDTLYDTYISLIFGAKKRVWIATPYFIPDETLTKALELTAKRNVDVHILLPKKSNHFLADLARGSYLRQLSDAGCKISLTEKMLHAKAVIIDDTAIMGSANFDMRSLFLNYEISATLLSPDAITALIHWFETLFHISKRSDLKVGYWRDLSEGIARVLGPMV